MDTDRLLFLFTCSISFLFCVMAVPSTALRKTKYLEPAAFKGGGLNDPCITNNDCGILGYFCASNQTCQCAKQYQTNYDTNNCLGGIDQKCQYDEHCIDGAYCMNQSICQCKENWPYASFDGMECSSGVSKCLPSRRIFFWCILLLICNKMTET